MRLLSKIARQIRFAFAETLDGYENPELVEVIFQKTKVFRPTETWTEIDGARTVLDFGGGCGIHYKMMQSPSVRWAVVETPAMADRASEIATENLRFFSSISDAAAWLGVIDVMHSSGALQYARDPVGALRELCSLDAKVMLWKRVALSDKPETESRRTENIFLRIAARTISVSSLDNPDDAVKSARNYRSTGISGAPRQGDHMGALTSKIGTKRTTSKTKHSRLASLSHPGATSPASVVLRRGSSTIYVGDQYRRLFLRSAKPLVVQLVTRTPFKIVPKTENDRR
jgi:hypothetical protein